MLGISKDSTYSSLREALASWQSNVLSIQRRLIASLAMTRSNIKGATKAHALRHCEHTTYAHAFSRTHKIVNEGAPNRPLGV